MKSGRIKTNKHAERPLKHTRNIDYPALISAVAALLSAAMPLLLAFI